MPLVGGPVRSEVDDGLEQALYHREDICMRIRLTGQAFVNEFAPAIVLQIVRTNA